MARTKTTARKSTGPKGVPRHPMATRGEASSGSKLPGAERSARDKCLDFLRNKKLTRKVAELTEHLAEAESRMDQYHRERDAALFRERQAKDRIDELTQREQAAEARADAANIRVQTLRVYIEGMEAHHAHLHEQVHVLWDQLHPQVDLGAAEDADGQIQPGEVVDDEEDAPEVAK